MPLRYAYCCAAAITAIEFASVISTPRHCFFTLLLRYAAKSVIAMISQIFDAAAATPSMLPAFSCRHADYRQMIVFFRCQRDAAVSAVDFPIY